MTSDELRNWVVFTVQGQGVITEDIRHAVGPTLGAFSTRKLIAFYSVLSLTFRAPIPPLAQTHPKHKRVNPSLTRTHPNRKQGPNCTLQKAFRPIP